MPRAGPRVRSSRRDTRCERGREARRKRKQRGFIGAAKALVTSDPERVVEQLASSPAGVVKLVSVLERHGVFEPPEEAEKPSAPARVAAITARTVSTSDGSPEI
jgi:predicted component of type VI protein secretion system